MTITAEPTYSTLEVAQMVGVSYRQLDYWVRTGKIEVAEPLPGSGTPRVWTEANIEQLRQMVSRLAEARATLDAFRTGALWKAAG